MKRLTAEHRGMLAAFFSNVLFGFSFLFSKIGLAQTTPLVLLTWRFWLALAVMTLLCVTGVVRLSLRGKPVGKLLLLGLFQPVLYFLFENYGLKATTATFSSVMIALVPVAALAFGAVFEGEKPTLWQTFFSVLSVGGVIATALLTNEGGTVTPVGVLLLIGAVASSVGFNVMSRRTAGVFSPFERTYVMFCLAAAVFSLLALFENRADPAALIRPLAVGRFWAALGYLGVASSVMAFFLINYANTYLPLARTTVFSNVITVVSVLTGVLFLHEPFSPAAGIAVAAIVIGIAGVQRFARREAGQEKKENKGVRRDHGD